MKTMKQWLIMACLVAAMFVTSGCIKPYDSPEYVEVNTSETAFLVPLEGDGKAQAKFDSEAYLEGLKVAAKRIQVPHRWNQTGRWHNIGEWIDTVRVIKVNRSPVTRQWSASSATAPGGRTATGSLWLESSDGIGFSMGFNCTAYIAEKDASKFLYWYKGDSLESVMDTEIKARYQQAAAEVAGKLKMDDLKEQKQAIVDAIKKDIMPFFSERGITITTVGQFGGIVYQDEKIREAIEQTYIAQQEKVNAAAVLAAQTDKNAKIELEAKAIAQAELTKAEGKAAGELKVAEALAKGKFLLAEQEAKGLREINNALKEANQNPLLLELRRIEVQKAQVEKWQGGVPQIQVGSGGGDHASLPTIILDTRK